MTHSLHSQILLPALLLVGTATPEAQAQQVYRWVDAQGKVHYADRQPEPQVGARAAEPPASAALLKLHVAPAASPEAIAAYRARLAQAEEQARLAKQLAARVPPLQPQTQPQTVPSSGNPQCDRARQVLGWIKAGTARHRNGTGAKTDAYDQEIYEREVRTHCK